MTSGKLEGSLDDRTTACEITESPLLPRRRRCSRAFIRSAAQDQGLAVGAAAAGPAAQRVQRPRLGGARRVWRWETAGWQHSSALGA